MAKKKSSKKTSKEDLKENSVTMNTEGASATASEIDEDEQPKKKSRKSSKAERGSSASTTEMKIGKNRASTRELPDIYAAMAPKQHRAVQQIYLGNTLDLKLTEPCYAPLVRYLIPKVDTKNFTLKLGPEDDPVVIPLYQAGKKLFGLKSTGMSVSHKGLAGGMHGSKGPRGIGSQCKTLENIKKHLRLFSNYRKRTCRIYTYSIMRSVLAPSSSTQIDLRLGHFVENVDNMKNLNLNKFVVDYAVKGADDIQKKLASNLVGSPYLYVGIFLDMADVAELNMPENNVFPRLPHIVNDHMRWIREHKGKYDSVPIKKLEHSCYNPKLDYNMEENYDNGEDCVDVWEDEGDDDMGHLLYGQKDDEGGESPKILSYRQKMEDISHFQKLFTDTYQFVVDQQQPPTILNEVQGMFEGRLANLPSDDRSSILQEVTTYVLSMYNSFQKKLDDIAKPLVEYFDLIESTDKGLRDCLGATKAKTSKKKETYPAKFNYPANGVGHWVVLYCDDLWDLESGSFISDRIITMHIHHLHGVFPTADLNINIDGPYHICDPLLWSSIENGNFEHGKSWLQNDLKTRNLTIDTLEYLFLLVNDRDHWSLATIHRQKDEDSETTSIFFMDSFGSHKKEIYYDLAESFVKNVLEINEITRRVVEVPQQGVNLDCAFFALYNIRKIITSELSLEEIVQLGTDWYGSEDASALRKYTMELLELNKVKYFKPAGGGGCKKCGPNHTALLKKFENLISNLDV